MKYHSMNVAPDEPAEVVHVFGSPSDEEAIKEHERFLKETFPESSPQWYELYRVEQVKIPTLKVVK